MEKGKNIIGTGETIDSTGTKTFVSHDVITTALHLTQDDFTFQPQ